MILICFCAWLKIYVVMSREFLFGLNIKLFSVTMKMSVKFASEAKFYMDFEPFTFGQ